MSEAAAKPSSRKHWIGWLAVFVIAVLAVCLVTICIAIERTADEADLDPADTIVVFGAAEYSGRPSPVFRARLDHAFDLFKRGLAPVIITTGGAAADPQFNEGEVGHDYLMHRGVPDASLIAETQASDTAQSAARVAVIMRTNHMQTCIAVSDAYHVFRIRQLLQYEGIKVYVAPRPDSRPHALGARAEALLREAVSYGLWRIHINR
jgi:uncharacterized SAM-binding protein YcdF (DUF218 family)